MKNKLIIFQFQSVRLKVVRQQLAVWLVFISIPIGAVKSGVLGSQYYYDVKFQFQSVRLKEVAFLEIAVEVLFQFQSVRLKVNLPAKGSVDTTISIPIGAVKSLGRSPMLKGIGLFQFQSVRLKGNYQSPFLQPGANFNSNRCG